MCVSQPPAHCDSLFHEHLEWLRDNVKTKLVNHCDDDTLFNVDAFQEVMRCMPDPAEELWMLGDCHKASWEARAFCGGGASYTFSASLLVSMAQCTSGAGRADDVQASWCALDGGAALVNNANFHYGPENMPNWVTAHHVKPGDAARFYKQF
jgi:hypothetical protein